jgi:hypothetical protein
VAPVRRRPSLPQGRRRRPSRRAAVSRRRPPRLREGTPLRQ